jgi:hypothetical protein
VQHLNACKHEFLLPEEAEWLPHRKTAAEPTAICYPVISKTTASLASACNNGAVSPGYLWLIGTSKVSLEVNPLNGRNSTHNK